MAELKPEQLARISFDRWKYSIQTAMGIDQLMLVVSAYLSGWDPKEWPFAVGFIASPDELMSRP